jgi:hypothetical protein
VEPDDAGPRTSGVFVVIAAASDLFSIGGEGDATALQAPHDLTRGRVPEKDVVDAVSVVVVEARRSEELTVRRECDELHPVFVAR